jgi:spermidine/putrescine transport system ATP-binding protein
MTDGIAVEVREIVKKFGHITAVDHVSLKIQNGEFFSLLGPSGCGKTTTLRLIAGFEMPTSGQVFIGGEMQGHLPAHQRPVNTVFQHYALFPHMNVSQNVAFGLEMLKVSKAETARRVEETLALVRLQGMGKRRPRQLSGGQQQRVALARALVNKPKVLLLDEPLGALDLKLRKEMQLELKALQHEVGITFIYVTHDQEEALTMSDRIAVMSQGRVLQLGSPEDIYENPSSRFVADFIGETNFIEGIVQGARDPVLFAVDPGTVVAASWAGDPLPAGTAATLSIRPEKITLSKRDTGPTPERPVTSHIPGEVFSVVYLGTDTRYTVRIGQSTGLSVRTQNVASAEHYFKVGEPVTVHWNPRHARVMRD